MKNPDMAKIPMETLMSEPFLSVAGGSTLSSDSVLSAVDVKN